MHYIVCWIDQICRIFVASSLSYFFPSLIYSSFLIITIDGTMLLFTDLKGCTYSDLSDRSNQYQFPNWAHTINNNDLKRCPC